MSLCHIKEVDQSGEKINSQVGRSKYVVSMRYQMF